MKGKWDTEIPDLQSYNISTIYYQENYIITIISKSSDKIQT